MEYILINFMLYVRGNFKNVTIDLAIHSHSAPIIRLRCISIARKKSYIYVKNLNNMTICIFILYLSLKYISYFHNIFIIFYGFYKHCCCNFFFTSIFTSFVSQK